jgi:hypothetical protein
MLNGEKLFLIWRNSKSIFNIYYRVILAEKVIGFDEEIA